MGRSSAGTAQPALDGHGFGSAPDITAKRNGLPPRSMPPTPQWRSKGANMQALALAFLAATAIGGLAWVFIYPFLSGEKKAELRRASIAKSEPAAVRPAEKTQRSRREQVEGSLKELEARSNEKKVPLSSRLTQAGLDWSPRKFMMI